MTETIVYPDVDTVHAIHADIVADDNETDPLNSIELLYDVNYPHLLASKLSP